MKNLITLITLITLSLSAYTQTINKGVVNVNMNITQELKVTALKTLEYSMAVRHNTSKKIVILDKNHKATEMTSKLYDTKDLETGLYTLIIKVKNDIVYKRIFKTTLDYNSGVALAPNTAKNK